MGEVYAIRRLPSSVPKFAHRRNWPAQIGGARVVAFQLLRVIAWTDAKFSIAFSPLPVCRVRLDLAP
jgi:hypothetical protein